jgi:hypothetical protein
MFADVADKPLTGASVRGGMILGFELAGTAGKISRIA